jgi:hypothetical protein
MLVSTVTASTINSGRTFAASTAARTIFVLPRVDRQHAYAQLLSLGNRCSNGVGNIVILQIQKYPPSRRHQIAHNLRSDSGIELHPDLVGQGGIPHRRYNLLSGGGGRNVERNDEPLARVTTGIANAIARYAVGQSSRHPG